MPNANIFYREIENSFITWAQYVDDIRAAFVVGSRARIDHPADEWSDLDIVFYTSNQDCYLTNSEWLENFGNVWTSFVYQTAGGEPERLTLFDGGLQVDFVINTYNSLKQIVENKTIPNNFYRGVKVIIDKDNISKNILPKQFVAFQNINITEEMFMQVVNMFWFAALYTAKQILKNELWVSKMRDTNLKELLLQVIEWNEKITNGNEYDTWHAGHFLCEWASKDIIQELRYTFGHFNKVDSWKALLATIDLFKRLSKNIAFRLNYSYPDKIDDKISTWINERTSKIITE